MSDANLASSVAAAGALQFVLGWQHHRWAGHSGPGASRRAVVLALGRRLRGRLRFRLAAPEEGLASLAQSVEIDVRPGRDRDRFLQYGGLHRSGRHDRIERLAVAVLSAVDRGGLGFRVFLGMAYGWQLSGIVLSLAGVAVVAAHGSLDALLRFQFHRADLWILASAVIYGIYVVLLRRRLNVHPLSFMQVAMGLGACMVAPLYVWELARDPHDRSVAELRGDRVYGGFPVVLVLFVLQPWRAVDWSARAGQSTHLMPLFGSLMAVLFLGETLHLYHLAGAIFDRCRNRSRAIESVRGDRARPRLGAPFRKVSHFRMRQNAAANFTSSVMTPRRSRSRGERSGLSGQVCSSGMIHSGLSPRVTRWQLSNALRNREYWFSQVGPAKCAVSMTFGNANNGLFGGGGS